MYPKESTDYSWILLKSLSTIFLLSAILVFRNEQSDRLYGVIVLAVAMVLLIWPLNRRYIIKKVTHQGLSSGIKNRSMVMLMGILFFILTQSYKEFLFSFLVLALLGLLFLDNAGFQNLFHRIDFRARYLTTIIFFFTLIAFVFDLLKTPSTLQDAYHPVFVGDEVQAPMAGLHNWRTYSSQYTSLLGYVAEPFLSSKSPGDLQHSTYTFLIVLQYITIGVLLLIVLGIVSREHFKWPFIFTFAVLSGSFFAKFGMLDWLQNFPSRTFFPIITLYLYLCYLKLNLKAETGVWFKVQIKATILSLGILTALGLVNDIIFGTPIAMAIILSIMFSSLSLKVKVEFVVTYILTILLIGVLLNLHLLRAPDAEFSLNLFTHYVLSYGESGFAKLYEFRGYEIFFWGFALSAIVIARMRLAKVKSPFSQKVLHPFLLASAFLVFSTVPYTTGRSFSAQIWASCGIYTITLFSCLFRVFKENEKSDDSSNKSLLDSHVLISSALIFTICSGILNPFQTKREFERFSNESHVLTIGAELNSMADSIQKIVSSEKMNPNKTGLLVPFGNNMSINLGISNGLFVNHPTSVIFVQQMDFICKRNVDLGRQWLILDSYLADLFRMSKQCSTNYRDPKFLTPNLLATSRL